MRARHRVRPLPSALLAGMFLVLPACSSGDPAAEQLFGGGASSSGGGGDDSVTALLGLLPPIDPDDLGIVAVSRWHAAADAYDVAVPAGDAPADEVLNYLRALTLDDGGLVQASAIVGVQTAAVRPPDDEFGFTLQEVAADISAGDPPQTRHAARGDFDPDAVAEATQAGPLGDDVEEVEVDGVPVLRWGEDSAVDVRRRHALSPIGGAGRLGLPDDRTLLYTGDDDGIAGMVAAAQGGESLADDEDLAAVAGALDAQGVLAAQLVHRPGGSDLPYVAAGIGFAWDGEGRVVLAYSADSESDAQAVASEVEELVTDGDTVVGRRPWNDVLADPEFRTDGSLVTATFTVVGPSARWAGFLHGREGLF